MPSLVRPEAAARIEAALSLYVTSLRALKLVRRGHAAGAEADFVSRLAQARVRLDNAFARWSVIYERRAGTRPPRPAAYDGLPEMAAAPAEALWKLAGVQPERGLMLAQMNSEHLKNVAVLVVDDAPEIARLIGGVLADLGCRTVASAFDGAAALEKLRDRTFDVVISDWHMAPVSGLDLVSWIRRNRALAHVRFVMVTESNDADEVRRAIAAGVNGYLLKPFTVGHLQKQLARVLLGGRDEPRSGSANFSGGS